MYIYLAYVTNLANCHEKKKKKETKKSYRCLTEEIKIVSFVRIDLLKLPTYEMKLVDLKQLYATIPLSFHNGVPYVYSDIRMFYK